MTIANISIDAISIYFFVFNSVPHQYLFYKTPMFYFNTKTYIFFFSLSGHDTDYLNLALRDGGVSLTMGLANGKQEMHIKPARVRFDDHQWHKVTVHRRIQEVSRTVMYVHIRLDLSAARMSHKMGAN